MAGISKRIRSSWVNSGYGIMKTATDTIITLPAVLYPNDTTATVGLTGNAVQSSTPSPTSPVMPNGTGDRTGNLIDVANLSGVRWATQYPALLATINSLPNGVYTMSISYELTSRNDVTDNSVCGWYIAKGSSTLSNVRHSWYTAPIGTVHTVSGTFTINDNNRGSLNALYLYGCGTDGYGATGTANVSNIMLNTGSTALPYEPYGHKIPISSASITTPVYLGEVETTRKIKKYEFTGQETDLRMQAAITTTNAIQLPTTLSDYKREPFICSHMEVTSSSSGSSTHGFYGQFLTLCFALSMGLDTLEKVRTYLQQQYANGTPVTVWYVLATEKTGIVNEPLMKIGDYADEVSGITIPVTAGGVTLSVGTTVQPSEVTVNYHGWHPAIVHERTNGAWT